MLWKSIMVKIAGFTHVARKGGGGERGGEKVDPLAMVSHKENKDRNS